MRIIRDNLDAVFAKDFLVELGVKRGFHSAKALEAAFEHVKTMRNRFYGHMGDERMRPEDERQLDLNLDQLEEILAAFAGEEKPEAAEEPDEEEEPEEQVEA